MSITVQFTASFYKNVETYYETAPESSDDFFSTDFTPSLSNSTKSQVYFSESDKAIMKAIVPNENIEVESLKIYLPENKARDSLSRVEIQVGYNNTSDAPYIVREPVTYNRNIGSPGEWFDLPVKILNGYLSGNCLMLSAYDISYPVNQRRAYSNRAINKDIDQVKIELVYHGHNSIASFEKEACEFGTPAQINITSYIPRYSHKLFFTVEKETTEIELAAGTQTYDFVAPLSWMTQIPNAVSTTLSLTITTYDGTEIVGDSPTIYIPIVVPDTIIPVPGTITYTVDNPFGIPISNRSITFMLSGTAGIYGSTVRNYILSCDGYSSVDDLLKIQSIARIPTQKQIRTLTATAIITDSRNRSATTTIDIDVYEWDFPFFSSLSYYRCNSMGVRSESGNYIRVQGIYECFPVNNLNNIQLCTMEIVERSSGTKISAGSLGQNTAKIIGNGLLDADKEYLLQITVADNVATIVYEHVIFSAAFIIHFKRGGTGVAFGQAATEDSTVRVNPNWTLMVGDNIDVAAAIADLTSRIGALEGES